MNERGVVDVPDVENLVEERFDAVKHISGSHSSG